MRKLILASAAAVALFGVAACSDTDTSTTQSVEPPAQTTPAPSDPAVTPAPQAPAADDGAAEEMKPATPAPSE
nr:hypothetical protein [Mesorhizobium sp.]